MCACVSCSTWVGVLILHTRHLDPHTQVAVTGASGKTGKLVVKRLLQSPSEYAAVAVVRSDKVWLFDILLFV